MDPDANIKSQPRLTNSGPTEMDTWEKAQKHASDKEKIMLEMLSICLDREDIEKKEVPPDNFVTDPYTIERDFDEQERQFLENLYVSDEVLHLPFGQICLEASQEYEICNEEEIHRRIKFWFIALNLFQKGYCNFDEIAYTYWMPDEAKKYFIK